jgi:serine/threonine-protein kinase
MLLPGDMVAGKYRIAKLLGLGGMGVVFRAESVEPGSTVAVKVMLPSLARREDARARFLREARSAASLRSEHVARVLDIGTLESGLPYFVMEYVEGADLGKAVREGGALTVGRAVTIAMQICEALGEAHERGLVHRDIKPSNIMLAASPDGRPLAKILDFGLVKAVLPGMRFDNDPSLTATGHVLGSPHYMSPEQIADSKTVDHRTDVYAVGAVLYFLLAGRPPFEGRAPSAVLRSVARDRPQPLRKACPAAPAELEAWILRCLEKDPACRIQSAKELARGLAPFASVETGAASPSASGEAEDVTTVRLETEAAGRPFRRLVLAWVAAGILVPSAALVLYWLLRGG